MIGIKYKDWFGDKRLDRRGNELDARLFSSATRSIQSMSANRAEQKSFYRFLHNQKTSERKIVEQMVKRCAIACHGRVVLAIQDSSEINLSAHSKRINTDSGIGSLDKKDCTGFKIHPSFVVDAGNYFPLGFSAVKIWHRPPGMADKHTRKYSGLPIEQKESYKWIASSEQTKRALSAADKIIIVQDREGDIFEQFIEVPDERTFLLTRSRVNRNTTEENKLWEALSASAPLGQYALTLSADSRRREQGREALIEVKCVEVQLKSPRHNKRHRGKALTAYGIEARELNNDTDQAVHWRLLTTWPVNTYEEILQVIEWYNSRWMIEELFRMLKKEGFNIEASEIENGWAIRKLTLMMLDVIIKLMQMHIAYHCPEGECPDTAILFNDEEQQCLQALNNKAAGKTVALQNPHHPAHLKWAVWIIARIGGWKGYTSQRPPGMTTLANGLQKFYSTYEGWSLQKDVGTR